MNASLEFLTTSTKESMFQIPSIPMTASEAAAAFLLAAALAQTN